MNALGAKFAASRPQRVVRNEQFAAFRTALTSQNDAHDHRRTKNRKNDDQDGRTPDTRASTKLEVCRACNHEKQKEDYPARHSEPVESAMLLKHGAELLRPARHAP